MNHSATYSPEDNKLRLYPGCRLPKEEYDRVRAAGFIWAPKQEIFVAPMWTPGREDLLLEMCGGEIGDEDKSLVERAEERSERFEDYSDKRAADAERAHSAVAAIADNIPFGQPILVGHHSERHARRDAEKIENGMRKAVNAWKTAEYWKYWAAGAIAHAKYKEIPAVRARRIKGIEADQRKHERAKEVNEVCLKFWSNPALTKEAAIRFTGSTMSGDFTMAKKEGDKVDWEHGPSACDALRGEYPNLYAPRTFDEVKEAALRIYPRAIARNDRWLEHFSNRLTYERAMLAESGGLASDKHDIQPGGRILRRGDWLVVLKLNKRNGVLNSVTVSGHFARTVGVDEIQDYRPPQEGDTEKANACMKLAPMCNYPGEGFKHMLTAEWKRYQYSDWPKSRVIPATETTAKHRVRAAKGEKWSVVNVYLTDAKRVDPPAPKKDAPDLKGFGKRESAERSAYKPREKDPQAEKFTALQDALKAGVQVVSAPQLFPTPPDLARRMVEMADIQPGQRVLEPSAGTGSLLGAMGGSMFEEPGNAPYAERDQLHAVEINSQLSARLEANFPLTKVHCTDFLTCNGDLGKFDRVLMNPPFENASDIRHIQHARKFLKPGGRIVAICANGPRQQALLKPLASEWIDLEPGAFKESGTNVNAALLVIEG